MSVRSNVMKQKGHKYFSQLTPMQKDKAVYNYTCMRLGIWGLDKGLQGAILQGVDFETRLNIRAELDKKGLVMFKHKLGYFPLKLDEMLGKN